MIYAKLDVCVWRHKKFERAGPDACGYWMAALAYLREEESSDGLIETDQLGKLLAVGPKTALKFCERLVEVELFSRHDRGYVLLGYASKNETSQQISERREATRERVEASRERKRLGSNGVTGVHGNVSGNTLRNELQPSQVQHTAVPGSVFGYGSGSVLGSLSLSPAPLLALVPTDDSPRQEPELIHDIFSRWLEIRAKYHDRGGAEPRLTSVRAKVIRDRLKEGYSAQNLKDALEGVWYSRWNRGDNDRATEYCDVGHAIGDGRKVEKFAELTAEVRAEAKPISEPHEA